MKLQFDKPIAFIDIEATGLRTSLDRIVEMTIIKLYIDGSQELRSMRINPEIPIPAEVVRIHGITDGDVAGEAKFAERAAELKEYLDNCDIGGFGIKRFDLPMLEAEFKRAGVAFSRRGRRILDAQIIYHSLEPRDLAAAYTKYCGRQLQNAHSSEADARAALEVLEGQLKAYPELPRDVAKLHDFCNPQDTTKIDADAQLFWSGGEAMIGFGKYRGKSLRHVASIDADYLQWVSQADFSTEVKDIAARALNGEFPEPSGSSEMTASDDLEREEEGYSEYQQGRLI